MTERVVTLHRYGSYYFCYAAKFFRKTFVTYASEIYDIGTGIILLQ